jgi:ABC-type polysaccharide/polyol phosphate transport system ATPase subunit
MTAAISFQSVSKHYRGGKAYSALREDLMAGVRRLTGRGREEERVVRALDDVTFDVPAGKSFALIGENGAGKTTLLKLASRITYPTQGRIEVRGRVGALIEVGTGLHPELTGRENVQLYGRILGLSARDINRRFDQIVEFADIGPAIDQPVKQYSSGMVLRLGFSVAAHVEPDVLLVDEAIAVGDAGFQHRCVERMSELVREGRSLVFVSHDMKTIEMLCEQAVRLSHGRVVDEGPAKDVLSGYIQSLHEERLETRGRERRAVIHGQDLDVLDVSILDREGREALEVEPGEPITVRLRYEAKRRIDGTMVAFGLSQGGPNCFFEASTAIDGETLGAMEGEGILHCSFEALPLKPRVYEVWGAIAGQAGGLVVDWQRLALFRIRDRGFGDGRVAVSGTLSYGPLDLPYRWEHRRGAAGSLVAEA